MSGAQLITLMSYYARKLSPIRTIDDAFYNHFLATAPELLSLVDLFIQSIDLGQERRGEHEGNSPDDFLKIISILQCSGFSFLLTCFKLCSFLLSCINYWIQMLRSVSCNFVIIWNYYLLYFCLECFLYTTRGCHFQLGNLEWHFQWSGWRCLIP